MNDVEPRLKGDSLVGECGCGCGAYGQLMKNGHVRRKCLAAGQCVSCRNRNNTRKGDKAARQARKQLGVKGANTRHEELWGGLVRLEMKKGAQVKPAITAFLRMEAQSEQQRPFGDYRPFVGVAIPDGSTDGVVMFRMSRVADVISALHEQLGAA